MKVQFTMYNIKHIITSAALLSALMAFQPMQAQVTLPDGAAPVIVAPHKQLVSFRERTLCYDITANVRFTATTDAEWISVRTAADGTVYVHLQENVNPTPRVANVVFANAEKGLSETLVITQGRNESIADMTSDDSVLPVSATANNNESGYGIEKSYDNDLSTFYHTAWTGTKFVVSAENPAILTYNFQDVERIDYVNYITRNDNTDNGCFGEVEIYVKCQGDADYRKVATVDWEKAQGTYRYDFEGGLQKPESIQFKVLSGKGDFASCAEMQFRIDNLSGLFGLFADKAMTKLKDGVTMQQIEAVDDDFIQTLAKQLYNGTYDKNYRVAEYVCRTSPQTFSEQMNAPGKFYDQLQGVTGINITKGKHAIAVSGLPDGVSVPLKVMAWYVGKIGGNFDGGNPEVSNFSLHNGLNVIDYTNSNDGLAYVCYYADANVAAQPKITVHFINGHVNGYLDLSKTNEEMHEICRVAPNKCLDVVGDAVHSIWTARGVKDDFPDQRSKGLYGNCVATDGTSLGYRQFIHVLDSLAIWEHDILGLHKYNKAPDNRTAAYVNFTYYMFQGGLGVSFHVDQEPRVLSCKTLVYNDEDCIWGLSHEWGHQHQMLPYFCWSGLGEVSNNMNSYFNIKRMGYPNNRMTSSWDGSVKAGSSYDLARKIFLQGDYSSIASMESNMRHLAYQYRNELVSTEMRKFAETMKDSLIKAPTLNAKKAISIHEVGVGETLCPFLFVYNYFVQNGKPDIAKDWYESLRQNDDENGSQVEKQGAVDKYELLASAMNGNKNGKYSQFVAKYPNSCWVKKGYLVEGNNWYQNSAPFMMNWVRKISRLSGYNLMPYFEQWGFFRQVALRIGDYGNKWMIITPEIYDEFKADMQALVDNGEIKTMPEGMVEQISNAPEILQPKPVFEN